MIGRDAKATHGAAGGNPATAIAGVRDVNWTIESSVVESSDRDSDWKRKNYGILSGNGSIEVTYDPTAASHQALDTAVKEGPNIAIKFLDATGGKGIYADAAFTSAEQGEPLEEAVTRTYNFDFSSTITAV